MSPLNPAILSPVNIEWDDLCERCVELENDIEIITNQFLVKSGSHYLFKKLQKLTEEYYQLDLLIDTIMYTVPKAVKKIA